MSGLGFNKQQADIFPFLCPPHLFFSQLFPPHIFLPHRSLYSPCSFSNPWCSVCDANRLLKMQRLWNMAFFGSSWDPEFRWGSLETQWRGLEGPQGAKMLQLIGSIKELNYPEIISAVGASSSSFLFLFPLTQGALTRFTHPDMLTLNSPHT